VQGGNGQGGRTGKKKGIGDARSLVQGWGENGPCRRGEAQAGAIVGKKRSRGKRTATTTQDGRDKGGRYDKTLALSDRGEHRITERGNGKPGTDDQSAEIKACESRRYSHGSIGKGLWETQFNKISAGKFQ